MVGVAPAGAAAGAAVQGERTGERIRGRTAVVAEAAEIRLTALMVVLVEEVEQEVLLEQEI